MLWVIVLASTLAGAGLAGAAALYWIASRRPGEPEADARRAAALLGVDPAELGERAPLALRGDASALWERAPIARTPLAGPDALAHALAAANGVPLRSVLDVGCGRGADAAAVARLYPRAQVTGIDASVALVREAAHAHPGPRFVACDACDMEREVPAGSVDLAYALESAASLDSEARRVAMLAAAARVLRPGGRLVIVDYVRGEAAERAAPGARDAALVLARALRWGELAGTEGWTRAAAEAGLAPCGDPVDLTRDAIPHADRAWRACSLLAPALAAAPPALASRLPAYAAHFCAAGLALAHALRGGAVRYALVAFERPVAL